MFFKDAGASCDSNYMCKSNLCSDGVCSIAQCTVGQEKCCDSTTSCSVNHAILECSSSGFWYQDLIVGKCGYSLGEHVHQIVIVLQPFALETIVIMDVEELVQEQCLVIVP